MKQKFGVLLVGFLALFSSFTSTAENNSWEDLRDQSAFTVDDIQLRGLQRVSAGTIFNLMPIDLGEIADTVLLRAVTRALFSSGYFNDIQLARDGGALLINFSERPAIELIEIEGNKAIESSVLLDGLAEQGLKEGEIFKQVTLERMGLELERQYVAQGRYGADITTEVEELPRNRVNVKILVEEGKSASIRHINIVGAKTVSQEELLEVFELKHPSLLSFYKNDDKYSREKLAGDLESLESYFKDRGYADFKVKSTQVSVAPDRSQVYISIFIEEGDVYELGKIDLVGELGDIKPEDLLPLIIPESGQIFSQAAITATEERIENALGNGGFTFASVTGAPTLNADNSVDLKFFVDSGKRTYVRRINFSGNSLTQDEVMRRESRQMEAGWASTAQIDLTKVRLERLGYFKGVEVDMPLVPGKDDEIDVDFSVEEQPSGSISGTLAYSQGYGLILGGNYQQSNLQGSGNSLNLGLSISDFQKSVNLNFFDPYFTMDGISRGYNIFLRRLDYNARNIARYSTDAGGLGVNFGFPIGETQRLNFGVLGEYTEITQGFYSAQEIAEFIQKNGENSANLKTNFSWTRSTLNRGVFATRGSSQSVSAEVSVPGSTLQFYKFFFNAERYFPLNREWSLRFRTEIGYGDGYGETPALPFYEHFYAGGFGSIRGFETSTLGPRSTPPLDPEGNPIYFRDRDGEPFGGNLLFELSAELIFPMPFVEDDRQFRPVLFVDAGNVFNTKCPEVSVNCFGFERENFRYSVGLGVSWLSGMGPLTFSIAQPFQTQPFDEKEVFQFELGRTF